MKKRKEFLTKINYEIDSYSKNETLGNYIEKENRIILDLKDSPIYQPYSNQSLLCNEIYDFIENTYYFVKKRFDLQIKILFPDEMPQGERTKIKKIIKSHYAVLVKMNQIEKTKINIKSFILLIMGILFFVGYGLLVHYHVNSIFCNIIEIASWVFIWESCDLFFFQNTSNKVQFIKNLSLFEAQLDE